MYTFLYLDVPIYNRYMNIHGWFVRASLYTSLHAHVSIQMFVWKDTHVENQDSKGHWPMPLSPTAAQDLVSGFHNQREAFGWDPNIFHQLDIWTSLTSVSASILGWKLLPRAHHQTDGPDSCSEALQQLGFCEVAASLLYYTYVPSPYWLRL